MEYNRAFVDHLPDSLTHLIVEEPFSVKSADNLPNSLKFLSLTYFQPIPLDHLPPSLSTLMLKDSNALLSHPVHYLPPNCKLVPFHTTPIYRRYKKFTPFADIKW